MDSINDIPKEEFNFKVPHIMHEGAIPNRSPRSYEKMVNGLPILWRENEPFKAAFKYIQIFTKTQVIQILFEDTGTGVERYMLEDDFGRLIKSVPAIDGVFVGQWRFRKAKGEQDLTIVLDE